MHRVQLIYNIGNLLQILMSLLQTEGRLTETEPYLQLSSFRLWVNISPLLTMLKE
jgi:hypothetical protein